MSWRRVYRREQMIPEGQTATTLKGAIPRQMSAMWEGGVRRLKSGMWTLTAALWGIVGPYDRIAVEPKLRKGGRTWRSASNASFRRFGERRVGGLSSRR